MKSLKLSTAYYIEDIRSAATKMHGSERRSFMAEMTLKHCGGNPRRRKQCSDGAGLQLKPGRVRNAQDHPHRSEISQKWPDCMGKKYPDAADALRQMADEHSQQDPTFRSTAAYTRLTARTSVTAMKEKRFADEQISSCSNMAKILSRMNIIFVIY